MVRQRTKLTAGAVLVADDHAVLRFGLVQLLRSELGVTATHEAATFQEALAKLRENDVAIAIFDLDMPGLTSPRELAEVRRSHPALRVVVLSGSQDRNHILAALEAGVHGYIIKSAQMDLLVERLVYIMSGEIYVPSLLAEQPWAKPPLPAADFVQTTSAAHPLSDRQRQVLEGLVLGHSNKQIARDLDLAEGTVKMHIGALFRALGAHNRAHAAALGKQLLE